MARVAIITTKKVRAKSHVNRLLRPYLCSLPFFTDTKDRKKLAQAGERISKLERQVDVQRQQLGQYHRRFYPSSRAVAEQRLMALGAALNYKILLKYDNVAVEVPSGEQAWGEFATHACYEDVAQAILQAQYLFDNLQALGMLAKRDSLVDHE
jgi:hypothetical protein